jgi:hypothetical protein
MVPGLIEGIVAFIAHVLQVWSTRLSILEHAPFHAPPDVPSIAGHGV